MMATQEQIFDLIPSWRIKLTSDDIQKFNINMIGIYNTALNYTQFQPINYSAETQSGEPFSVRPSPPLLEQLSAITSAERKEITAGLMGHPLGCHWCITAIQHKIITVDTQTILPHLVLYSYGHGIYLSNHVRFCPVLFFMSHAKKGN